MATKKKLLQAAAGSAGGAGGLDIPDVFSTYLYEGNQTDRTITNGINLSEEGGLVWIKEREAVGNHFLFDTERPLEYSIQSNEADAQSFRDETVEAYNTDGFDLGTSTNCNQSNIDFVSWTWRKAPKFFDIVTYTGDGVAGREISHSLNSEVGLILVKQTNTAAGWYVLHKDSGLLILNETVAQYSDAITDGFFGDGSTLIRPTSSVFTLGDNVNVNGSGNTYVAYLFAHNDGDGDFGPDSDQDIIKCGSIVGDGTSDREIDLGFEPQWLLIRRSNSGGSWALHDNMRGMIVGGADPYLLAQATSAEGSDQNYFEVTPNGFKVGTAGASGYAYNESGDTYIYIAIRRGPLAVPEDATDVFDVETRTAVEPAYVSGFPVDMALRVNAKQNAHNTNIGTRLTGKYFANTDSTYQFQDGNEWQWDYMNGWNSNAANDTNSISWMWKRAPSFCDVVCWKTENTANRRLKHNLGVAPEMVWIKNRATEQWYVYQSDLGSNIQLRLDTNDDVVTTSALWPSPSATEFGIRENAIWNTGTSLVGFFFATLDGISKVGSYTGNGSSQTIDCGFTAGSRFILIKRTDANGNWVFFDSVRGIVSGISPSLFLNDTEGERTYEDVIDPANNGFTVIQETQQNLNVNGGNYIFYAIA